MMTGDQGTHDAASLMGKLVEEFRCVLDDTVIIAILGDYDLNQQFDEARAILEGLSKNAIAEEASGFIAGGVGGEGGEAGEGHFDNLAALEWPSQPNSNESACGSRLFTDTSSRTDFSEALSERFESLELLGDVDASTLDEDGKVAVLKTMFPGLKEVDFKFSLKKAGGDLSKVCDELLSAQYLEENGLRPKGIEGAFRLDDQIGHKKGCKSSEPHRERAGKMKLDVNYRLKPVDLCPQENDFKSPLSPAAASFTPLTRAGSLTRSKASSSVSKSTSSAPHSPVAKPVEWHTIHPKQRKTYSDLALDAEAARQSTEQSFTAAHQAWRKGKSDVHFRPVAGVFAERAREQLEHAKAVQSQSYDALVDEQSSFGHIDLHGVPVADGVRIALARSQAWWSSLGEDRTWRAREEGFVVVTGLGNHNSKGVSRLRQDVGAALKRAGWKVRVETGQFVITGRT